MKNKRYLFRGKASIKKLPAAVLLLMLVLVLSAGSMSAFAEEDYDGESYEEEEEFIPEAYYDPIQTNEIEGWPQGPMVQAASAIVMDMDTGTVLYGKNVYDKQYPASITKIMTTLVALEQGSLDDVITCGDEVYDIEYNSSNLGIQPGEELTLRQALYGLMLESANDIGNALAVHYAGSNAAFAELMNEKAAQLGCSNTHFTNPHGLHSEEHYTCAYDMALIAQAAYANETFREIVSTRIYTIPETNITEEERPFANHHRMMHEESDYYRSYVTGGKTGFTTDAWNTLVTYGEQDSLRLVCVLLRENGAYRACEETADLMEYGFANFIKGNATEGIPTPTFYDILNLNYPNEKTLVYRDEKLQQKTVSVSQEGVVTVPKGADLSLLTRRRVSDGGDLFQCLYHDWPVGYGSIHFTALPTGISFPYQQPRDMETLLKEGADRRRIRELQQTAQSAWEMVSGTAQNAWTSARAFVDENRMTAALIGAFLLVVLLILIVILVLRCTKDYRIQKKRRQEEFARARTEDEIDRMSAVQIEEELREAMEEERARRQREQLRREQARLAEQQLRETEQLLEEIRGEHID